MSEIGPTVEQYIKQPLIINLRERQNGRDLSQTIRISNDFLPTETLQTMLQRTNETGAEQGLVGGITRHRKTIFSKIIEGSRTTRDEETGREIPASVNHSLFFPFGLRHPLLQFPSIFIHTHPPVKGLSSTIFSDTDIKSYINNKNYNAFFAIDNGGIHILVGRGEDYVVNRLDGKEILDEATEKGEAAEKNRISVARAAVAEALIPGGIRYYFAESVQPQTDGTITFRDVRDLVPKLAA